MTSNLLDGKVAIVTGSSRSIGAAIVKRLAQDGAKVVVNYHKHDDSAKDIVNAIRSDGGVAIAVKADASTVGGGEVLLNECLHAFGRVDILVLNAGSLINETLDSINDEYFNSVFNLHVKGPLFLARAVAPHLQAGTVFTVTTVLNLLILICRGAYHFCFFYSYQKVYHTPQLPNACKFERCYRAGRPHTVTRTRLS